MICKEIIEIIENQYPKSAALDFDNVGLQVGRIDKEVKKIYLALDATEQVISQAIEIGVDLLITHHPLIFSPRKSVTNEDFIGRRIVKLLQNDVSYYAMHTNYDVLGLSQLLSDTIGLIEPKILWVTEERNGIENGIGRVGNLQTTVSLEECCGIVKNKLDLSSVKVFGEMSHKIQRVAVSPGSGKDAIEFAIEKQADVLITGDIGHHAGLDAMEQGLSIIDAGHYGTEYIFEQDMQKFLEKELQDVVIVPAPIKHPFYVVS